jgi:hypothetical protein
MMRKNYGVMAAFATEEAFLSALARVKLDGHRKVETFTPYAVEGGEGGAPSAGNPVAAVMLVAGIVGGIGAYFMQWYATRDYWLNVGGRPVYSWPAFVPVTFELTVLSASLAGVVSMLWLAGLPRLDHPVFSDPRFRRASQDRFFICIRVDEQGNLKKSATESLLRTNPESTDEVFH